MEERDMRQGYAKPSITTQPLMVHAPRQSDSKLLLDVMDKVQNPLQYVTNFAQLNIELLADLKNALLAGNKAEVDTLMQDITRNSHCIEEHGKRLAHIVTQLQPAWQTPIRITTSK